MLKQALRLINFNCFRTKYLWLMICKVHWQQILTPLLTHFNNLKITHATLVGQLYIIQK